MKKLEAIRNRIHGLLNELESLEKEVVDLTEASCRDPLTSLYRREAFLERFESLSNSTHSPVCLMVLDIDHFKKINDTQGHAGGDEVLKAVAAKIAALCLKAGGLLAGRFGGEEFLVAFPGELSFAQKWAENLRESIASLSGNLHCTASIGLAQGKNGESFHPLFERADQALYAAKNGGRNQTRLTGVR